MYFTAVAIVPLDALRDERSQAVDAAVDTGAWMINVHASGGAAMMRAAVSAGADAASRLGRPRPLLIGVTVLTSMDAATLASVGVDRPLLDQVVALARLAQSAGLDGVVASPQETAAIRHACGSAFAIVTGIATGCERVVGAPTPRCPNWLSPHA